MTTSPTTPIPNAVIDKLKASLEEAQREAFLWETHGVPHSRSSSFYREPLIALNEAMAPDDAMKSTGWPHDKKLWPDPTQEMLASNEFEAIWQVIKRWDINVPHVYGGYCHATGNHVRAILDAIAATQPTETGKSAWDIVNEEMKSAINNVVSYNGACLFNLVERIRSNPPAQPTETGKSGEKPYVLIRYEEGGQLFHRLVDRKTHADVLKISPVEVTVLFSTTTEFMKHGYIRLNEPIDMSGLCYALEESTRAPPEPRNGWQLVPKEPTEEMIAEGLRAAKQNGLAFHQSRVRDGYKAMLAASPPCVGGVK